MPRIALVPASIAAVLLAVLTVPMTEGIGTSADCGNSVGAVDQLVCARADLSAMNKTIDALYRQGLSTLPSREARDLRLGQQNWDLERYACIERSGKETESCLRLSFEARLTELSRMIDGGAASF